MRKCSQNTSAITYVSYLNGKMPKCNTVGSGGGGNKQDRINYFFFLPFISSFELLFVFWPALGMLGFLTIHYSLAINNTLLTGDYSNTRLWWLGINLLFTSSHYPHKRCFHKLFVRKSIFDINQHFLDIDFCMLLWPCLWKKCQIEVRKVAGPEFTSAPHYQKNQFSGKCF